jgi:sigma-B regulation protein RsbU (phosphoserine phosphatase)
VGLSLLLIVFSSTYAVRQRRQARQAERQLFAEMETELQTAHDLQMGLMPEEAPRIAGLEIAGRCLPANHVGGDLFQYFHTPDKLSLALADVTGHAMEAAIPVVMFCGVLRSQLELGSSLEALFDRLNRSLYATLTGHTFVCFTLGELEISTRILRLSNSGCPYPYHYRASSGEVVELRVNAYPLGIRPDTRYPVIAVQLEPGDWVVFCSDGIVEAANAAEELFGFERLAGVIREGCVAGLSATGLLERVFAEVQEFAGGVPQGDDQTGVVLKIEGEAPKG